MDDCTDDPLEAARKRHEQEARDFIAKGMTESDFQRSYRQTKRFFSILTHADRAFQKLTAAHPDKPRRDLAIEAIAIAEREVPRE